MASKNMNYIFNVEYFDNIFVRSKDNNIFCEGVKEKLEAKNKTIFNYEFTNHGTLDDLQGVEGSKSFKLFTSYPGMLIGTGYPHEIAAEGALKCGFLFDYVTGLPYVPGSSLKGMLRAYFPGANKEYGEYIKTILSNDALSEKDIEELETNMFDDGDVFLGAYPEINGKQSLLDMEYITPHKEKFKNPIPISLLKIKPGVCFKFGFIFKDYRICDNVIITAEDKLKLCKQILLDMGIGAKTNVGFGVLLEKKQVMHELIKEEKNANKTINKNFNKTSNKNKDVPKCRECKRNECSFNSFRNMYYPFCTGCHKKINKIVK